MGRRKRKVWLIGIVVVVILVVGAIIILNRIGLEEKDEQDLLDTIAPTIVRIEPDKMSGSGVIWSIDKDEIVVITGGHVLEDETLYSVIFYDGIPFAGEIIYSSKECDLCFVRVDRPPKGTREYDVYRSIYYDEDKFEKLQPGDEIFTMGSADYPAGNLYYGTIGNVSIYMNEFGMEMLWGYCDAKAGMSGGGTFDKEGNFIGMISGGNDNKEIAVLPLDSILKEWENVSDKEKR